MLYVKALQQQNKQTYFWPENLQMCKIAWWIKEQNKASFSKGCIKINKLIIVIINIENEKLLLKKTIS